MDKKSNATDNYAAVKTASDAIRTMTRLEDLKLVHAVIRARWTQIQVGDAVKASAEFALNQSVWFVSKKTGEKIVGTIESFNRKSVTIAAVGGLRWRVSPHVVHAVKDDEKVATNG